MAFIAALGKLPSRSTARRKRTGTGAGATLAYRGAARAAATISSRELTPKA